MATSKKVTELQAITSAANGDLVYIVHDPAGVPVSNKITVENLLKTVNNVSLAANAYANSIAYTNTKAAQAYTNAAAAAANAYSNSVSYTDLALNNFSMSISLHQKYYEYINTSINGSGGLDNQFSGLHEDDDQHEIALPFPITFLGQTYSSIWIHTNSYIAFGPVGSGTGSPYYPLGPQQIGVPAIMLGATDREMTAYYYGTVGNTFIVHYEGVDKNYGGDGSAPSRIWELQVDSQSPDIIKIIVNGYNIQPSTGIWGAHDGTKWVDIFEPLPFVDQNTDTTYYGVQLTSAAAPISFDKLKFIGTGIDTYVEGNTAFIEVDPLHGILNVDLNDDGDTVLGSGYYGMHLVTSHEGNLNLSPAGSLYANAGSASAAQPGDGRPIYLQAGNAYSNSATTHEGGSVYITPGAGSNGGANGRIYINGDVSVNGAIVNSDSNHLYIKPSQYFDNQLAIYPTADYDIHLYEANTNGAVTLGNYGATNLRVYGPGGANGGGGQYGNDIRAEMYGNSSFMIAANGGANAWFFDSTGAIVPPTGSINHAGSGTIMTIGAPGTQSIVTGPATNSTYMTAERFVIQGQKGYDTGEGGDIYLWAGHSGDNGGSGGDIKVDAGIGYNASEGGTIKIRAGQSQGGQGGFVEIWSGQGTTGANIQLSTWNPTLNQWNQWNFTPNGDVVLPGNGSILDSSGAPLIRDIPQNFQNSASNYTLQLIDRGKHVLIDLEYAVIVPDNGTVAFPKGTAVVVVSTSHYVGILPQGNSVIYNNGTGAFSNSSVDLGFYINPYSMATLLKVQDDTWILSAPNLQTGW